MTLVNYPAVVGLIGASGAGKSTVAQMLVREHGYTVLPMSCVLKDMLRALGFTEDDLEGDQAYRLTPQPRLGGMSPRQVASTLGTDWARDTVHPDLLVNAVEERIERALATGCRLVVDGMRFPNEVAMIHRLGGHVWRVRRPGVGKVPNILDRLLHRLGMHPRIHESEYHWPTMNADFDIGNTSGRAWLRQEIIDALVWRSSHVQ